MWVIPLSLFSYASFTSQELWFKPLPTHPSWLASSVPDEQKNRRRKLGAEVQADLPQVTQLVTVEVELETSHTSRAWPSVHPPSTRRRPVASPFENPKTKKANQQQDCETLWSLPLPLVSS